MLPEYLRRAEHILSEEACADIVDYVASHPKAGIIIRGTGGIRKLRLAQEGMGQREERQSDEDMREEELREVLEEWIVLGLKHGVDSKHCRHKKRELRMLERFLRQFHMVMLNESIALVFCCPSEMEELPREEAESALALAQEVYAAVLSQLPAEVRP